MSDKIYDKTLLVRPEHLNHSGTLFGGYLMKWADEMAYTAAYLQYHHATFVTKLFETFDFRYPVGLGDVIIIRSQILKLGRTSCRVRVWAVLATHQDNVVFETHAIMVNVKNGKPEPIESVLA